MNGGKWRVGLLGGLELRRPDGSAVHFPTRRAGAVFAILVLRRGRSVARSELCGALWPAEEPAAQQVNLRKAISLLKRCLGDEHLVVASRDSCRLAIQLVDCPDLESLQSGGGDLNGVLLPEMTERFFDRYRRKGAAEAGLHDAEVTQDFHEERDAATSLLDVLEWTLRYRPRSVVEIIRSTPELVYSAEPERLLPVLDSSLALVGRSEPLYGWALCQRGFALAMLGGFDQSLSQLDAAKERAIARRDAPLLVEASFNLAAVLLNLGRSPEALELLTRAMSIKWVIACPESRVRLRHGFGLALIHSGHRKQGLSELRGALEDCDETTAPFERAYVMANLAWFESTCGSTASSTKLLKELQDLPASRSWRLRLTAMLSSCMLSIASDEAREALATAQKVIDLSGSYHAAGFEVYGHEMAALAAGRLGEAGAFTEHLERSKQLRRSMKFAYTAWDRHRLKALEPHFA